MKFCRVLVGVLQFEHDGADLVDKGVLATAGVAVLEPGSDSGACIDRRLHRAEREFEQPGDLQVLLATACNQLVDRLLGLCPRCPRPRGRSEVRRIATPGSTPDVLGCAAAAYE